MVSARTSTPGCSKIFSTRPSEGAGTQRTTWGTKVPLPRTSRTIGPRLTVSITAVERSSVGAAGFSFARASVTPPTVVRPIRINIAARIRLVSFDFAFRLISMNTRRSKLVPANETGSGPTHGHQKHHPIPRNFAGYAEAKKPRPTGHLFATSGWQFHFRDEESHFRKEWLAVL